MKKCQMISDFFVSIFKFSDDFFVLFFHGKNTFVSFFIALFAFP